MSTRKNALAEIAISSLLLCAYGWVFFGKVGEPSTSGNEIKPETLTPEQSQRLLEETREETRAGHYEEALKTAKRLHRAYPENHIYIEDLAEISGHLGHFKEEAAYWEEYLDHAPIPVQACPQVGIAYEKQNLRAKATEAFERCLALDPTSTESLFYLGHSLEMSQKYDQAAEIYKRGVALSSMDADLQIGLARVRLQQGEVAEAKSAISKILKEHPTNGDAILVYALACWRSSDLAEARRALEKGIGVSKDNAELHATLGRVLEQAGDPQGALREYDTVLRLNPADAEISARRTALLRSGK